MGSRLVDPYLEDPFPEDPCLEEEDHPYLEVGKEAHLEESSVVLQEETSLGSGRRVWAGRRTFAMVQHIQRLQRPAQGQAQRTPLKRPWGPCVLRAEP